MISLFSKNQMVLFDKGFQQLTRWNRQINGTDREMFTTVYDAFSKDDVAQLGHLKS